jgi:ATP synthase in type III secretion protein N
VDLDRLRAALTDTPTTHTRGRVLGVSGLSLEASLPGARVGDLLVVRRRGGPLLAEVVGFRGGQVVALPFGPMAGVGPDDAVEGTGGPLTLLVGEGLLGRVLDGLGRPLDGGAPIQSGERRSIAAAAPSPLARQTIREPLATGVRALDGLCTLGVGQRLGLFAGSGVGKSVLLGSIARGAPADVIVVALVGERGREVGDFISQKLADVSDRAVVVAATSDAAPLERLRAAEVATTIAEFFRDAGQRVLLLVDSVTRVARAQRDVGLAAGELPARRGFPPSVFSMLPGLLERAGQGPRGSITAIYTVLVEGDDLDEPVADEVRGLLDGHLVLSRALAERGHFPAIDVPASVSRVMDRVTGPAHRAAAERVRAALGHFEQKRDLVTLGAYRAGSDARLDRIVAALPRLDAFLRQRAEEQTNFGACTTQVEALAEALP